MKYAENSIFAAGGAEMKERGGGMTKGVVSSRVRRI